MQSLNQKKYSTSTTKPKGLSQALYNLSQPLQKNKQKSRSAFPLPSELEGEPLFTLEEDLAPEDLAPENPTNSEEPDEALNHSDSDDDLASYGVGAPPSNCLAPSKKRPAEEAKRDKQTPARKGTPPIEIPLIPDKPTSGFLKHSFLAEQYRAKAAKPIVAEEIETNVAIYGSSPQSPHEF